MLTLSAGQYRRLDLRQVFEDVVEQDVIVLLTEQNVQFALDLAERAYVIETGSNVWDGSVAELREREDLLEEYLPVSESD